MTESNRVEYKREGGAFLNDHIVEYLGFGIPHAEPISCEAGPESGLESGPEPIQARVQQVLSGQPLSKSGQAKDIGLMSISCKQKERVRALLKHGMTKNIFPEKPNSRLQQYRMTTNGRRLLQSEEQGKR